MERAVLEACGAAARLLDEYVPVEIACERYTERDPHPGGQEAFTIRGAFPEDPTVYLYAPRDPALAPPGSHSLFLMANAPGNGRTQWDATAVQWAARRILERLRRTELSEVADSAEIFHITHPGDFQERFLAPGGAIYGQNSHGWRRAFFRPPNRALGLRGLYCTGGSYHPGGGVPMVLMSAEITAALIAEEGSWTG